MGFRVPQDVEGYAVEPESGGGRDGSRCTSRTHGSPNAGARTGSSGRGGGSAGGPSNRLYIWRSDVQNHSFSMNCPGRRLVVTGTTARAHTEECRRECLIEDEETRFRSESRKLRVDGSLVGRVESAAKSQRSCETESNT